MASTGLVRRNSSKGNLKASTGLVRRSSSKSSLARAARPLTPAGVRPLLPALHKHTQGKAFGPQALRTWLRIKLAGKGYQLPSSEEAARLLASLARKQRRGGGASAPLGAWVPQGVRYEDPEGTADVSNIRGFAQGPRGGGSVCVSWHEQGAVYYLQRGDAAAPGAFRAVCVRAFKRVSCSVAKRHLRVNAGGEQVDFKSCVVFNPRQSLASTAPRWTLIYLHSFSNRGTDYFDYPHIFGISGASLRVVLPTAPQLEQTCFKDWMVWRGERLQWRRIKFNAWFDYLTDRAGKCENDIDLGSLLRMRARIHALIRSEVARLGGDAKRVIIGGMSQGCCVALDAALTYPEELGGVVGLVGHVLGSTPLDTAKRTMPLHLFHEASDKEMNWKWVKDTVQRLIDAGFDVKSRRELDPSGSGHWIQEIEGPWIRSALRRIIFSSGAGPQ